MVSDAGGTVTSMQTATVPDYSMLVVNRGEFRPSTPIDPPRPVLVRTQTYGGRVQTLLLEAVSTARGHVCVSQSVEGWPTWKAWVPAADCRPL